MSSTVKVIWIRFSWPPEGLSLTRTSRETMGFCLSSPASRSSLWATWIVPVTKKAEVRGQMKDKGTRNMGSTGMTVLEWWLVYPGDSPVQTSLSVKGCVLLFDIIGHLTWPCSNTTLDSRVEPWVQHCPQLTEQVGNWLQLLETLLLRNTLWRMSEATAGAISESPDPWGSAGSHPSSALITWLFLMRCIFPLLYSPVLFSSSLPFPSFMLSLICFHFYYLEPVLM